MFWGSNLGGANGWAAGIVCSFKFGLCVAGSVGGSVCRCYSVRTWKRGIELMCSFNICLEIVSVVLRYP